LLTAVPRADFDLDGVARVPAAPTQVLHDGDVIDLGDRAFEVLHIPGHSPGSIGLWDATDQLLFSGDAVYDGPLLDEIEGADIDAYVTTMRKLRQLPVTTVHGGHDPSMDRRRFREVIDAYLARRAAD
jgi:glyoxylase-like metal-dependent hydrolase (beta-lactamase superfamily II)